MSDSSGISEKAKLYIGIGAILFIIVSIFCGGMFVGCHYKKIDCPDCPVSPVCDEVASVRPSLPVRSLTMTMSRLCFIQQPRSLVIKSLSPNDGFARR